MRTPLEKKKSSLHKAGWNKHRLWVQILTASCCRSSLNLSFLICTMGIVTLPSEDQGGLAQKVLMQCKWDCGTGSLQVPTQQRDRLWGQDRQGVVCPAVESWQPEGSQATDHTPRWVWPDRERPAMDHAALAKGFLGKQTQGELRPCPCPRPQRHQPQTHPLNPHG